eukprot:CAMPEP_0115754138 /NCGR_PEP_ID=MMETSP0272-20121206/96709_1 /TAXON_ID=71861 /ORGANISM="Scrippsiella trochoidea, Strain CCMP3099" /LENGTH=92 /DNA_ID=CAMNT_0003199523 /DNA_START=44 /DNA_END=319 /DNA_ORIENTATION=-
MPRREPHAEAQQALGWDSNLRNQLTVDRKQNKTAPCDKTGPGAGHAGCSRPSLNRVPALHLQVRQDGLRLGILTPLAGYHHLLHRGIDVLRH